MITQVVLGNALLTGIGVAAGVVVFGALVWAWLHEELAFIFSDDGKHKEDR